MGWCACGCFCWAFVLGGGLGWGICGSVGKSKKMLSAGGLRGRCCDIFRFAMEASLVAHCSRAYEEINLVSTRHIMSSRVGRLFVSWLLLGRNPRLGELFDGRLTQAENVVKWVICSSYLLYRSAGSIAARLVSWRSKDS